MSDEQTALDPRRLRIMAPLGQWIPDNTGNEVHYAAGTVLPESTWLTVTSQRSVNTMIKAGDLAVEPNEVPAPSDSGDAQPGSEGA